MSTTVKFKLFPNISYRLLLKDFVLSNFKNLYFLLINVAL